MSDTSTTEPDPVAEARTAWHAAHDALERANVVVRAADRRLSNAVTAPRPDRIDHLAAEAYRASTAWGEAIAAEDAAYKAYVAAKAGA